MKSRLKPERRFYQFYLMVCLFCLYSFIGWMIETIYVSVEFGHFAERGFLLGPLCPIYGFSALLITFVFARIKSKPGLLFITAAVVLSAFEYLTSVALEFLFDAKWWDYSNKFLNLDGRICLLFTLVWGLAAVLLLKFIDPALQHFFEYTYKKIPCKLQKILPLIVVLAILTDFIFSVLIHARII